MARRSRQESRRNAGSLFPGCPLPFDQRRLTGGDYKLQAITAVQQARLYFFNNPWLFIHPSTNVGQWVTGRSVGRNP